MIEYLNYDRIEQYNATFLCKQMSLKINNVHIAGLIAYERPCNLWFFKKYH